MANDNGMTVKKMMDQLAQLDPDLPVRVVNTFNGDDLVTEIASVELNDDDLVVEVKLEL
jgi:hypothetical protein